MARALKGVRRGRVALVLQLAVPGLLALLVVYLARQPPLAGDPDDALGGGPLALPSMGLLPALQSVVCLGADTRAANATRLVPAANAITGAGLDAMLAAVLNVTAAARGRAPPACLSPPRMAAWSAAPTCACLALADLLQGVPGLNGTLGPRNESLDRHDVSLDTARAVLALAAAAVAEGLLPVPPAQAALVNRTVAALTDLLSDPAALALLDSFSWDQVCRRRTRGRRRRRRKRRGRRRKETDSSL